MRHEELSGRATRAAPFPQVGAVGAELDDAIVRFELAAKSSRARIGRLRRALEGEEAAPPASRIAPVPREAG